MRQLDVPTFYQHGKPWCGPASAKMILGYHRRRIPLKDIASRTGGANSYPADIGLFLLEEGFSVTLRTWRNYFPNSFCTLSRSDAHEAFVEWCKQRSKKRCINMHKKKWRAFMDAGGMCVPQPVDFNEIKRAVKRKEPPILCVHFRTLYEYNVSHKGDWGHYVIPLSIGKKYITIVESNFGRKRHSLHLLLHACHTCEDSAAIFVKPPI